MQMRLSEEDRQWMREIEALLQGHHTDVQRLWRRCPQLPDPEAGIPLSAPPVTRDFSGGSDAASGLVPDDFLSGRFGPYSGVSDTFGNQFARPDATIAAGQWTGVPTGALWDRIDETSPPDDTDYIHAPLVFGVTSSSAADFRLSDVMDPSQSGGHIMRIRSKKVSTGGSPTMSLSLILYEGNPGAGGTAITSEHFVGGSGAFQTDELTLTAPEADSITDYSNLYVRFFAQITAGSGSTADFFVSWFELEVPRA